MLCFDCLVLEEFLLPLRNLSEYLKTVYSCLGASQVFRWVSVVYQSVLFFLVVESFKDFKTLFFTTYGNVDNSLKCLTFVFILEYFALKIF